MIRSWDTHVGFTFCEGAWSPDPFLGIEELMNCLSSCVLLGVGIKGGSRPEIDDFTCLLYGALSVCGAGSFMFHARLIEAFRFVDELAILFLVSLGFYVTTLTYYRRKMGGQASRLRFGLALATITSFIGIAEIDIFYGNLYLFGLLIGVLVSAIFFSLARGRDVLNSFEQALATKGQDACGVATVAWIVDMGFCWEPVSYLYLHALWHCLMALTINCCLEIYESQIKRDKKINYHPTFYGPFVFGSPFGRHHIVV